MNANHRMCVAGFSAMVAVGCAKPPQPAPQAAAAAAATRAVVADVAPAAPAYRGNVVELRGSAAAMGARHGKDLHDPIQLLHEKYLNVYLGGGAHRFVALTTARLFESYFRPEHLAEVDALAKESGLDEREAVLAQCFLDLSPMTACSTITLPASASADHVARFARNLDFPSFDVADKYSTVFVYHPDDGRYAFAAIGWPGMVGVLSGMNQHGLALSNMEVTRSVRLPGAMPYTLLYRTVLEHCRTVKEAIALIEQTPRQTANNLMLMDATGDRAVVEITPQAVAVRRAADKQPLISTNHQRGADCDTAGMCWRYDRLHETAQRDFGHIDVKELESMLGQVAQGRDTLQSMIFEPANRVIYLATGAAAPTGIFYRLDLKSYFQN